MCQEKNCKKNLVERIFFSLEKKQHILVKKMRQEFFPTGKKIYKLCAKKKKSCDKIFFSCCKKQEKKCAKKKILATRKKSVVTILRKRFLSMRHSFESSSFPWHSFE